MVQPAPAVQLSLVGSLSCRVAAALATAALLLLVPAAGQAQQTGSIAGVVRGSGDQPLVGAQVQALSGGRIINAVEVRDDGTFRIDGLAPGGYAVIARRVGYSPARDTAVVAAGQTVQLTLTLAPGIVQLEQVVVSATGVAQSAFEAPASISVVSAQEIAERPAVTVVDNLRAVPGLDIAQGGLVQSAVVARGFNNVFSGALLTLIDHRFASVPSLRVNVPFLFTTSNDDVERIEVLLGPAAALYGPNSANGVLHVITKSPFGSEGTTLTLDAGERSLIRTAGRHAGTFNDRLGYKISGEFMRGRDWQFIDPAEPNVFPATPNTPPARVGQPNVRDFDVEKWGGEARLDWRFADDAEWINSYGITHAAKALELTGANGAGQLRDWRIQTVHSRARIGRLFAQAFMNFSDAGNDNPNDLGGTYLLRTGQPIVDNSTVFASQVRHSSNLGERQQFVYGIDYILTTPRTGGTINGRNEDDDNVNEIGGYVSSTTALNPQFDLLLAARLDRHSRMEGNFFSPRAAVVYKPTETQNLRLTFNRAYSTPANFSFFLDLLQAANIGGLPYNIRAVGVPESGFQFRRDCTGGAGDLCMRSPFTPEQLGGSATFVPANAAAYYPAALQVAVAGGLQAGLQERGLTQQQALAVIQRLAEFNAPAAGVQTQLAYVAPTTTLITPEEVRDVDRLKATFTNVLELGYKGVLGNRLRLAVDSWYQRRENFITPAVNFTPNALLHGPTLGAALAAHLAPLLGPNAPAVAAGVATEMARIPLGTVVPDSRVTTNADLAFTYQNIDRSIDLYGADLAVDYVLTEAMTVLGTYSWVSDVEFPEIQSGQRPLTLNAPDHKASVTMRYQYEPRDLSFELRGRYQNTFPVNSAVFVTGVTLGENPPGPNGPYQYRQPPTSMFVDAQVVWRLPVQTGRDALLSINGTNLNNRKVPMFAGVPEIGRMVTSRLSFTF